MSDSVDCTCGHCGKQFRAVPMPQHRVMCGDSTDPAAVGLLMAGERASLVACDPPYGVAYDGNQHRRQVSPTQHGGGIVYDPIENDDLAGEDLERFCARPSAPPPSTPPTTPPGTSGTPAAPGLTSSLPLPPPG